LEIKIEDEAEQPAPPSTGNLYTTNSTLGNFGDTPNAEKLILHTQKLTPAMRNRFTNSSKDQGSFMMKKKLNGSNGISSIRSSSDRDTN
jgi:hypothetical protein